MRDSELARYARHAAREDWPAIALDFIAEIAHTATRRAVASECADLDVARAYVACHRSLATHTRGEQSARYTLLADRIAECIASGCFT